jgi:HEPN domain-containing protein
LLHKENGFPDIIVYHLHQGIEKIFKGLILEHGENFPFIHDLERLFKLLQGKDGRFEELLEPVILLQSFYKDLRYPQSEFLSANELGKALAAFNTIIFKLKSFSSKLREFLPRSLSD